MSMKHRILATVGAATLEASFGLAAAPAGAGDLPIGIPRPCTHGCGGDPTPWNDDDLGFTNGQQVDPPTDHPADQPVVADANFTG